MLEPDCDGAQAGDDVAADEGDASMTSMPTPPPITWVPVTSVPMKLPSMEIVLSAFDTTIARLPIPDMTLRAEASGPPTTANAATSRNRPSPKLSSSAAAVPAALVPMRLPWMAMKGAVSVTTAATVFPERRFLVNGCVPPMATWLVLTTRTPKPCGPGTLVPDGSVPM